MTRALSSKNAPWILVVIFLLATAITGTGYCSYQTDKEFHLKEPVRSDGSLSSKSLPSSRAGGERYGLYSGSTVLGLVLAAGLACLFLWRRQQMGGALILAQKEAEQGRKLSSILSALPDQIFLIDRTGRCQFANQATLGILNTDHQDIMGADISDLGFPPDIGQLLKSQAAAVFAAGRPLAGELSFAPAREERYYDYILVPLPDGAGTVSAILTTMRDVTDHRRLEMALRESEEKYRHLVETANEGIFTVDRNICITYVNQVLTDLSGYAAEELLGQPVTAFLFAEDLTDHERSVRLVQQEGQYKFERRFRRRDGTELWAIVSARALMDDRGEFQGAFGTLTDITERKQAEAALRESEAQYRLLVETIPAVVARGYVDWTVDVFDEKIEALTGYPPEVFNRRELKWNELILAEDLPHLQKTFLAGLRARAPYVREYRIRTKGGEIRWIQERSQFIFAANRKFHYVSGVLFDITEGRQAEEAVRESEESLRQIVEMLPVGVWVTDHRGNIVMANSAGQEIWGGVRYVGMEHYGEYKAWWWDTGEPVRPEDWTLVRTLRSGTAILNEVVEIEGFDGARKVILNSAIPLKNARGQIVKAIAVNLDITDRIHFEARLQASLREKEVLLKEIHHRVKNNMQIISSLLRLQSGHFELPEVQTVFQESQNRIQSMALVHEMLYQSPDLAHVSFAAYVADLAHGLYRSFQVSPTKVALHLDVADISLPVDLALPCGLILNELVSNTLKYAFPGPRQGELRLRARKISPEGMEIVVQDNGVGLPADLDIQATTSLGLRLVVLLVGQLQGTLELDRKDGTTVLIKFPVHDYA